MWSAPGSTPKTVLGSGKLDEFYWLSSLSDRRVVDFGAEAAGIA